MNNFIATDKQAFVVEVDANVYTLLACQKACYALMQYMSSKISTADCSVILEVFPTRDCDKSVDELKELLFDELLDYSLREKIFEKTDAIRTLILSNAFSNTKLVETSS